MGDDHDLHLGKRLRQRRRSMGLTQEQLADAVGVRFQQIQKYEAAVSKMSATRIWALAGALDVPVSYFFEGLPRGVSVAADGEQDAPKAAWAG